MLVIASDFVPNALVPGLCEVGYWWVGPSNSRQFRTSWNGDINGQITGWKWGCEVGCRWEKWESHIRGSFGSVMGEKACEFRTDIFNNGGEACFGGCHLAHGEQSVTESVMEWDLVAASATKEVVAVGVNEFVAAWSIAGGVDKSRVDHWEPEFSLQHDGE